MKTQITLSDQVTNLQNLILKLQEEKQEIQEQLHLLTSALSSQKEYDC